MLADQKWLLFIIYINIRYVLGILQLLKQSSDIFPFDFILFSLFRLLQRNREILIYSTKYWEIILWTMENIWMKTYYGINSFEIVQARYRRLFNFNTFPNRSQILKIVKYFKAHGSCEDFWAMCSLTSRNVYALSSTLHASFNCAFNWMADTWSMYYKCTIAMIWLCVKRTSNVHKDRT